ncbi:hypothetical protein PROFUN_07465 [Planoprotostelium fungivorum]|uniref:Uncharacterized protein n=1 Tax=Planoprotostelium fungivorum TaxID=1890364 RepID=A0A2P6NLH7_9EUKA|nr:hypothetical protein PROFUN_07465 [Planoprotostelium fungivorum]
MSKKEDAIGLRLSVIHMMAGATARLTTAILLSPADLIKTRLQATRQNPTSYGIVTVFKDVIRKEGPKGFIRGLGPRLIYIVPSAAISFFCYERITSVIKDPAAFGGYNSAIAPVVGVTIARLTGSALRTPFDVVRQRLQMYGSAEKGDLKAKNYDNTYHAIRHILKTESWRGLFVSVQSAIIRDASYACLYFTSYEVMKWTQRRCLGLQRENEVKTPGKRTIDDGLKPINHALAGSVAGIIATTLTIPFDVVKTRLQTQAMLGEQGYKGVFHTAEMIKRQEGWRGLTRGLGARLIYIIPAAAIVFTSYEQYKRLLDNIL